MEERKNTLTVSSLIQEVIWPSRCAICDTYGENPCQHCKDNFPFLDYWQACPFCGAPYGRFLCSECDGMHSRNLPEAKLGFSQCRSVCTLTDTSFKIISAYKDKNAQELHIFIAESIKNLLSPSLLNSKTAITYIPASKEALKKRGFDHMELVAYQLAELSLLPVVEVFLPPEKKDQRKLSRKERFLNMNQALRCKTSLLKLPYDNIILIDDVYTTGSSLAAASTSIKEKFPNCNIFTYTFARTM